MKNDIEKIMLFVEGEVDRIIVEKLFEKCHFPKDKITIIVAGGSMAVFAKALRQKQNNTNLDCVVAVLLDNDTNEFTKSAVEALEETDLEVFFTPSEIEAWLFADDDWAIAMAQNESAKEIIKSLPMPDEIQNAKKIAYTVFGASKNRYIDKIHSVNIEKAVARSMSLKYFLMRIGELLGEDTKYLQNATAKNLNLQMMSNLLAELNDNTIVFRTADGHNFTAREMYNEVKNETLNGRAYISDLLRISRDFLKRQVNRVK